VCFGWEVKPFPFTAKAAACDLTISTKFPSAMLASRRCKPQAGVGLGFGVGAPSRARISSTVAPSSVSQRAL
jgi:hypothetical protein